MLDAVQTAAQSAAAVASAHVSVARESATVAASSAANTVHRTVVSTAPYQQAIGLANQGYAQGMDLGNAVATAAKQKTEEIQKLLEIMVKKKLHAQLSTVVDQLPEVIKDGMEDPDMPRFISRGKDRMIDAVWPDIREEIMWEVAVALDGTPKEKAEPDTPGPDCFRAYFRYHIFPYNRTFWGSLRDPVLVLFTLISAIPLQGVCPFMYFLVFLLIDKTDEFQLLIFILQFKGTQFISLGIIRTIVGFFLYVGCVSVPAEERHFCDTSGPGSAGDFYAPLAGFVLQVLLVWAAFLLLPCSKEKGRDVLRIDGLHKISSKAALVKGGYIKYFMYWDLIVAILCIGSMGYIVSTSLDDIDAWPMRHALYAIQCIYGFLSMPFFIFTLPVIQNVLTHAVPTAYDPKGRCRKKVKPVPVTKKREEKHVESQNLFTKLFSEEEMNELVRKIKEIMSNVNMPDMKLGGTFGPVVG